MEQLQQATQILNARITNTSLGYEGGIIGCTLHLQTKGFGTVFGGYCLHVPADQPVDDSTGFGMEYITRVLDVVGVQYWEQIKDQAVRIAIDGSRVVAIGHLIEEKWFTPAELGDAYQAKALEIRNALEFARANKYPSDVDAETLGKPLAGEGSQPVAVDGGEVRALEGDGEAPANVYTKAE